jgi:hypothetical protein
MIMRECDTSDVEENVGGDVRVSSHGKSYRRQK